jgi:hypothetical protein
MRLHGVQADSSQLPRNQLYREPASLLELMSLRLGYELPPDVQVLHRPPIRPVGEDIVRHDVIVTKRRHNRYNEVVRAMFIVVLPKDLLQL